MNDKLDTKYRGRTSEAPLHTVGVDTEVYRLILQRRNELRNDFYPEKITMGQALRSMLKMSW